VPQSRFSRLMVRISSRISFATDGRPGFPSSNLPSPEKAKALALPAEDRGGLDEEDPGPPVLPDGTEPSPQKPIRRR
jgi:hypothetical protein